MEVPVAEQDSSSYLFVVRDVSYKDLEQLRRHSRGRWCSISQSLLYAAQRAWLPQDFFPQLEFQQRLRTDAGLDTERPLRFALTLLRTARERHAISAVVSSNVDYAQDEFLRRACRQLGLPFVVLLKEHVNTAYGERVWSAEYERTGYRYDGDAVAVFGPRTRDILVRNEVCDATRIAVTGPPRFDAWRAQPETAPPDAVVLCAFSHPLQEGASAFPEVLREFVRLAQSAPETPFLVKCRDQYEVERVRVMLPDTSAVTLTHAVPMSDLLARAVVVIGYGSLALVEALYSSAEVVAVRFAGCTDDEDVQFDERDATMAALVRFAHSAEALAEVVRTSVPRREHPQRGERLQLLEQMFCAPEPSYSAALDAALAGWTAAGRGQTVRSEVA
jgi:hypothetical protein